MVEKINKQNLHINQIVGEKQDNFIIEEDFVVPDIKPDILNVISTSGIVCIYKKEILDKKVKIDGSINCNIIYLANDDKNNIRNMNFNLEFSKMIDIENINKEMFLDDTISIKEIECMILNERKINLKCILDVNLRFYFNEEISFIKDVENIKNLQVLNKKIVINSLIGNGIAKVYAKDTIALDEIDNLVELLKSDVCVNNIETKISYNKVLVKAETKINIMYLTDDNKIKSKESIIPTMGFIDLTDACEDNFSNVKFEIKNIVIKPNSMEEHSVYIEIEYEVRCSTYERKEIDLIEDLYSPSLDLSFKQKKITTMSDFLSFKNICNIKEKQYIEEMVDGILYDVQINPKILKQTLLKGRIIYDGEIEAKFIFKSKQTSLLNVKKMIIPFNYSAEENTINSKTKIETKLEIISKDFVIMPDFNIDIKIDIAFLVKVINNIEINVIDELEIKEDRNISKHSVIIYFVRKGDTLWNIAKKFKSTINDIIQINNIEDENKINVGDQLFIPYVNY